jgi:RNA ligase (TIGR02306 family)
MAERKMAYVRRIDMIEPIDGADRIEKATLGGWDVVVQKGIHSIGDLVCYMEIDSFVPVRPWSEFLLAGTSVRKMQVGEEILEGIRLRTKKLRGVVSQGLCLPLSEIRGIVGEGLPTDMEEGHDLSELLGVIRYEAPVPASMGGQKVGTFPSFIPKTDAERVQNVSLDRLFGLDVTEKVDGSSCTFWRDDEGLHVCSKNIELVESDGNSFWRAVRKFIPKGDEHKVPEQMAFQGELLGPGIEGNSYKLPDVAILLFGAYSIKSAKHLAPSSARYMAELIGARFVPKIETPDIKLTDRKAWIAFAEGKSALCDVEREGIVVRLESGSEPLFKVISNVFLLNEK